jgi:hypothetical protein
MYVLVFLYKMVNCKIIYNLNTNNMCDCMDYQINHTNQTKMVGQ